MATSTSDGLFFIQTSLPPSNEFSTIDVHSDRPIPTAGTTEGGLFSIETQTSLSTTATGSDGGLFSIETQTSLSSTVTSSDGGLFSIETQTSLTGTTSEVPSQTTSPASTTGTSAAGNTNPTVSATTTPSGAGHFDASMGLVGLVMLAWMGLFSFRR